MLKICYDPPSKSLATKSRGKWLMKQCPDIFSYAFEVFWLRCHLQATVFKGFCSDSRQNWQGLCHLFRRWHVYTENANFPRSRSWCGTMTASASCPFRFCATPAWLAASSRAQKCKIGVSSSVSGSPLDVTNTITEIRHPEMELSQEFSRGLFSR